MFQREIVTSQLNNSASDPNAKVDFEEDNQSLKLFHGVFYKKVAGVIRLGFLSSLCLKSQRLQACRRLISIIGTWIGLEFSLFSITFQELTIAH